MNLKKITAGILFAGGGVGKLNPDIVNTIWANEIDSAIATIYKQNYPDVQVIESDIADLNITQLPYVDYIHASPPCQLYSAANKQKAPPNYLDAGMYIMPILKHLQPDYFTLENVTGYRNYPTFKEIERFLLENNYHVQVLPSVNTAKLGLPQERKRLILAASKYKFFIILPEVQQVGWYHAVKELIEPLDQNLVPTHLISRQQARLDEYKGDYPVLIVRLGGNKKPTLRSPTQPCPTIRAFSKISCSYRWADIVDKDGNAYQINQAATARLMGMDDYKFPANKAEAHSIIGNGVPPLLLKMVLNSMLASRGVMAA